MEGMGGLGKRKGGIERELGLARVYRCIFWCACHLTGLAAPCSFRMGLLNVNMS